MRNMGGLRRHAHRPRTMFIATLAIAGIPPFAGFFSKDEILWQAYSSAQRAVQGAVGAGVCRRADDRLLHVPADVPDLPVVLA